MYFTNVNVDLLFFKPSRDPKEKEVWDVSLETLLGKKCYYLNAADPKREALRAERRSQKGQEEGRWGNEGTEMEYFRHCKLLNK